MFRITRPATALAAIVAIAGIGAGASPAAGSQPQAHAAAKCSVGDGRGYGYSYLTSLQVSHTSCSVGRTVARHHGHVRGWSCHSRTLDSSPVQYDRKVSCRSHSRQVVWTYTQNT